jgi:hypothetical protein
MKKVVLLFVVICLFSCGAAAVKADTNKALYEILTQQSDGGANICFYEILSEQKEISMLLNDGNLKKKIKQSDIQTSNFIVLNMGEKNSDGYKIDIESVVETDKNIIITIKEIAPKSNFPNVQDPLTPYTIVKINSKKDIIIK